MRFALFLLLWFALSCSSTKKSIQTEKQAPLPTKPIKNKPKEKEIVDFEGDLKKSFHEGEFWKNHMVGLVLYDLEKRKNVISINADKYFTPASNIKLFTLYTALKTLEPFEPLIEYAETPSALYFRGTGHPAFLHPHLPKFSQSFDLLNASRKQLIFVDDHFVDEPFNPGWALDDVHLYYQTDKSALPVFGNVSWVSKHRDNKDFRIVPLVMKKFLENTSESFKHPKRDLKTNKIFLSDKLDKTRNISAEIPFIYNPELVLEMLSDTLNRKVHLGKTDESYSSLQDYPTCILYKEILKKSDNHIAEQLLLMASHKLFDSLNTNRIIRYSLDSIMMDIPHQPKWVDGSGLSRYNLCTPESLVWVLEKLNRSLGKDSIQTHFQKIQLKDGGPFAYAKTGSLSNNFNLSGYLKCQSGKTFAFSFMNNHYMKRRKEVFGEVKKVLMEIWEEY